MLKDTKSLGNNKAPACESRGFVHKKRGVHFDTPPCFRTFPRSSERIKDMLFDIHPCLYRSSKRDVIENAYYHRHIRQCKYMAR